MPAHPHYLVELANLTSQTWIDARDFLEEDSYNPEAGYIVQDLDRYLRVVVDNGGLVRDLYPHALMGATRCSRRDIEHALNRLNGNYENHVGFQTLKNYVEAELLREQGTSTEQQWRDFLAETPNPDVEEIDDNTWTEDAGSLQSHELPSDDDMENDQEEDEE